MSNFVFIIVRIAIIHFKQLVDEILSTLQTGVLQRNYGYRSSLRSRGNRQAFTIVSCHSHRFVYCRSYMTYALLYPRNSCPVLQSNRINSLKEGQRAFISRKNSRQLLKMLLITLLTHSHIHIHTTFRLQSHFHHHRCIQFFSLLRS